MKDLVDTFMENNLLCPDCGNYEDELEVFDIDDAEEDKLSAPEEGHVYTKCGMCGRHFG